MKKRAVEDLEITAETTVAGIAGRICVTAGGALVLIGKARDGVVVAHGGYARIAGHTEGLFVAVGGDAVLTGTCHGAVVNDGGHLRIEGSIDGPLLDYAGDTIVDPRATISEAKIVKLKHPLDFLSPIDSAFVGHPHPHCRDRPR